jgi:hypothetical protein
LIHHDRNPELSLARANPVLNITAVDYLFISMVYIVIGKCGELRDKESLGDFADSTCAKAFQLKTYRGRN